MIRLTNRTTGSLLAAAGIATATAGSHTAMDTLAGALLLLGSVATVGGLSLATGGAK